MIGGSDENRGVIDGELREEGFQSMDDEKSGRDSSSEGGRMRDNGGRIDGEGSRHNSDGEDKYRRRKRTNFG